MWSADTVSTSSSTETDYPTSCSSPATHLISRRTVPRTECSAEDSASGDSRAKSGSIVSADYRQIAWDDACREACRELVRMAMREDLGGTNLAADITTLALVPPDAPGHALVGL